jgi:prepilin-type N-terminal cleavage/methylation domain-containing protein
MHRDSGLTAIEVAVTLAIIALLATVSMPSFLKWLQAHRLRGAAINLMADFEMAKVRAVREGTFVSLEFFADTYRVFIDDGSGVGGVPGDMNLNGTESVIQDRRLPTGVSVSLAELTDSRIRFNSRGLAPDLGAAELIPLVNPSGRKTVRINRLGSVRIQ